MCEGVGLENKCSLTAENVRVYLALQALSQACANSTFNVFCVINLEGKFTARSRRNATCERTLSRCYYSSHFTSKKRHKAEENRGNISPHPSVIRLALSAASSPGD